MLAAAAATSLGACAYMPGMDGYPGGNYPGAPYPGGTYPGGNYPGGNYPGGNYPGAPYPGGPSTPYPGSPYPGAGMVNLDGTRWRVERLNNQVALPNVPNEVYFDRGRVSGTFGCNNFNGTYSVQGDRLSVSQLSATRMACDRARMDQDLNFGAALQGQARIYIERDGRLVLTDDRGNNMYMRRY